MRRFLFRCLAVLAMSSGSVALAGLGPNGLGPNGLGPNGLGPNGLGPNGLGPNGLGPNGLGPNGLGPNGLGPNGLGPNGLGPNGLNVNGLGPNGLGPNGLGPVGLGVEAIYLITPDGKTATSEFKNWFEADPAAASQYMRYFARCAYDRSTGLAYLDSTGRTWLWTGQFGFAMASLKSPTLEPLNPNLPTGSQVRSRMTAEEGKWVSACLLAHVNIRGAHQYISLRGSPPNPEAAAALAPGGNEQWIMGRNRFGTFFGDLFSPSPVKYACTQGFAQDEVRRKEDVVLGRNCDVEGCTYTDASGETRSILTAHLGSCWTTDAVPGIDWRVRLDQSSHDPYFLYRRANVTLGPPLPLDPGEYRGLFVSGPTMARATPWRQMGIDPNAETLNTDVAGCNDSFATSATHPTAPQICTADDRPFQVRLDSVANRASCGDFSQCIGGPPPGVADPESTQSYKLVGIREGQAIDLGVRFTPMSPWYAAGDPTTVTPDMDEPLTAIVRYSKDRAGAANLWVSRKDGSWGKPTELPGGPGPDVWPATGAGNWEWLQVYPVYLGRDRQYSRFLGRVCLEDADCSPGEGLTCSASRVCTRPSVGSTSCYQSTVPLRRVETEADPVCVEQCTSDSQCGRAAVCEAGACVGPAAKVRLSGAAKGTSCTGPKVARGDGEAGTCSRFYIDWKKFRLTCFKAAEGAPACRGSLVFVVNSSRNWGWRCVDGGAALKQCTAADAPDFDTVGFVPGKPWCAPAGATSFVGVCK